MRFLISCYPCLDKGLSSFSKSLSVEGINTFMALRKKRCGEDAQWFAVDSTSFTSFQKDEPDAKWGRNKEGDKAPQVDWMIMYDIKYGLPTHYRKPPGNIPDSRTIRLLLEEFKSAGYKATGLVLDRGYLCKENLDFVVPEGIKAVFMAKRSLGPVKKAIQEALGHLPAGIPDSTWTVLADGQVLLGRNCEYKYSCKADPGAPGRGASLPQRLCLYFSLEARAKETEDIFKWLHDCETSLDYHIENGIRTDADFVDTLGDCFKVELDEEGKVVSWARDDEAVRDHLNSAGFFAIVCCNMDDGKEWSLAKVHEIYSLRRNQEECFKYVKTSLNGWRLRSSAPKATEGRLFFQFVTLILDCALHNAYDGCSKELRTRFVTPWMMLDEMKAVKLYRLKKRVPKVSEFVGAQVDIFDEMDLTIPRGCRPKNHKKKTPKEDDLITIRKRP